MQYTRSVNILSCSPRGSSYFYRSGGLVRDGHFFLNLRRNMQVRECYIGYMHGIAIMAFCYYVDGQKIAKKLCLQITRETKAVKSLLEEHACQSSSREMITLAEALDPSIFQARIGSWAGNSAVTGDQQEAIQAYLTLSRSIEELTMLKDDAHNMVLYYERKREVVCSKLASLSAKTDLFSRGSIALLYSALAKIENLLEQARLTVQTMTSSTKEVLLCAAADDDEDSDYCSYYSDQDEEF